MTATSVGDQVQVHQYTGWESVLEAMGTTCAKVWKKEQDLWTELQAVTSLERKV